MKEPNRGKGVWTPADGEASSVPVSSRRQVCGIIRETENWELRTGTDSLQFPSLPKKMDSLMKTKFSSATPAQLETECLVVIALDRGSKDKPEVTLETTDEAVRKASEEVIASGELTGKSCEVTLLHHPAGLKAKRLLVLGGGTAQAFSGFELRRVAGVAVRALKSRGLRTFAFALPQNGLSADQAIKTVVEGAFVGNFDADTYRSDRKDQKIDNPPHNTNGDAGKV